MKFHLVDKIESIEPGKRIATIKAVSLAEEYLADHFPAFPVLPGVMMIEALVQSAAWLIRVEQDFANSIVVLAQARNVKYASFVPPGKILRCDVEAISIGPAESKFKASGYVDDEVAVSAKLTLRSFNLVGRGRVPAGADAKIVAELKDRFRLVGGPDALAAAAAAPAS